MIEHNNMNPVDRLLASLDGGPEIENFATDEIEALPIDTVRARLQALGLDPRPPSALKEIISRGPTAAQKVLDALREDDLDDGEIEGMDLNKVQAALHNAGIDYRAGIEHVRELTGADRSEKPSLAQPATEAANETTVVPFRPRKPIEFFIRWAIAPTAAVAAAVCLLVVGMDVVSLRHENAALQSAVSNSRDDLTKIAQELAEMKKADVHQKQVATMSAAGQQGRSGGQEPRQKATPQAVPGFADYHPPMAAPTWSWTARTDADDLPNY